MGLKRLGRRAAGDAVHHGRFDFQKIIAIQILTHGRDHFRTNFKGLAHIVIHHQIHIAVAVADFQIGQPVPFFRHGMQ